MNCDCTVFLTNFLLFSIQVLLTTDTNNSFANVSVWDLESGATRNLYKNGTSAPNTLNVLGDHYLVSAQLGKPVIQLWEAHKRVSRCFLFERDPG